MESMRKGAWDAHEDILLRNCIEKYGEGKWHLVSQRAGNNLRIILYIYIMV